MNRKEQIENLEAEIAQKQQTLNQLKDAEENEEQEQTIEPNQNDIDAFLSRI